MAKNEVRIISGLWKGRKLRFTARSDLRPTLGRARETLFNWLAGEVAGRDCLDLFAGSGALGFEAASRGASQVTFVEKDRLAAQALRSNLNALASASDGPACSVRCTDALRFLESAQQRWDVVFVDPPFASDLIARVLPLLNEHINQDGAVYVESSKALDDPVAFQLCKQARAGDTYLHLLRQR